MPLLRRYAPDALILLLLLLLPLGFFFPQTLGGRTLLPADILYQYEPYATYREVVAAPDYPQNHLVADLVVQNMQWKAFLKDQLAAGEIPLWNPRQFSGIPFLAAGQHSALYPLSIIYYALPLSAAYGWFTVINLWLAGAFMYMLGRGLGIGRAGATLAGVVYQFGGFVIASVVFQMMIGGLPWLPLLLLMTEFIIRERAIGGRQTVIPWVVIGAGAVGMNILAGHVEITIYTLLITAYVAAGRLLMLLWRERDWQSVFRRGAWIAATVALGFGLGAIQFVPLLEFVQVNWRADRASYETVVSYAHPLRDVLQFVMPNFYGSPAHHSVLNVFTGDFIDAPWTTLNGDVRTHTEWGIKNYVEGALYVGILPLLLSVYALLERVTVWRNETLRLNWVAPYRRIFGSLALLSLTFMFGLPTYRLIYVLPGINQLNSPFRWVFALTVCVALLAGFGLDALMRRAAEKKLSLALWFGGLCAAAGMLVLLGLGASYLAYPALEPTLDSLVRGMVNADSAFASIEMFYSYQFGNAAVFGVMLLLSGAVIWWAGWMRAYRGVNALGIAAVAVVAADLMIASWGFNPSADPKLLDFTPPAVEWLQGQTDAAEEPIRYTTLQDPTQRTLLPANLTMRYGLYDVRGYDSIIPKPYVDYMQGLQPQVQLDFNRIAPLFLDDELTALLRQPQLDALNVRYIITHKTLALGDDLLVASARFPAAYELAYEDAAVRIYENTGAAGFIQLVETRDNQPPTNENLLGGSPVDVTLQRDTGRERVYQVDLQSAATQWLVVHENYMPGWRAFVTPQGEGTIEERPLPVERVRDVLKGVRLTPTELDALWETDALSESQAQAIREGRYSVRAIYSPASVQVGIFGSVISVVIVTLMLGMWLWRWLVGVNTDESSQTARVARNSIAPILLNLFNRGIDFAFLLVMVRILSPEQVGIYYYLVILFEWFDILTNFGLDLFLTREVSRDKSKAGLYFVNGTLLRLVMALLGVGVVLAVIGVRQATVDPALDASALLALALLYVGLFPGSLSKGMTSVFYAFEEAEKPAAIATITSINKAIFGVVVLLLGYGIVGLAAVSILNNLITFGVLVYAGRHLLGKIFDVRLDASLLREMVREGFPLMLNHFLATIFFKIDVVLLEAMRGAGVVARYSIAYKWILAINIIPSFFTQALLPVMSRQADEDRATLRRNYRFGIKLLVSLALPLAVIFTAIATPLALFTAGAPYLPASAIAIQLMIWSIPIGWMNSLTQYVLVAMDLQRQITGAFVLAVGFNLVTNALLIPTYGYQAAALTTIASEAVLFVPFAILTQRGLGAPVGWWSLLWRPLVATGVMLGVTLLGVQVNLLLGVSAGCAAYALVLLMLNPLEVHERERLLSLLPERALQLPFMPSPQPPG